MSHAGLQKSLYQLRQAQFLLKKSLKLSAVNDWEGALRCTQQALMFNDRHFLAWHTQGELLEKMGRNVDAIAAYNRALQLEPNNSDTLLNKGVVLAKMGRYLDAIRNL